MQANAAAPQPVPSLDDQQTLGAYVRANYKTIAVVLVIGLLLATILYQRQTTTATPDQKATSFSAQTEASSLRQQVAAIVELPSNETPTIATVEDPSKLKNQEFFARAKAGDKVLMFAQAKLVVLYRPSSHKIVQIAPINLGSGATASTVTGQ